ncbi:MAG: HAD family hydrolase [Alphaproteobacteria bacterium]|nr:HAD family hydrolase [Alphaproteobacteria bacterium]MCL2504662.1 HAD family hydrolase [Alphaproteobacteria bacterium]
MQNAEIRNQTLPEAMIFDWDNTLVDSWGAIGAAINHVRGKYGLKTWDNREEMIENCSMSARNSFPEWFGDKWEEARKEYYKHFSMIRAKMGINKAYGVQELLEWLKENNIPAMVVSNKSGGHLREEAEVLNWKEFFEAIVGAGDAHKDKPNKAHPELALTMAGLEHAKNIWFVGDAEVDVACAKSIGCVSVIIGREEDAKRFGTDLRFQDCMKLLECLKGMKG